MKFLCGGCKTKYQISDEKLRSKILTIRCKKCGAKILVRESLAREAGGTAVAPIAEDERAGVSVALSMQAPEHRSAVGAAVQADPRTAALASAFDVAMRGANDDDMPTCIAPTPANLDVAGVEWYVAIDGVQSGPFAFAELVRRIHAREVAGRHYVWHDGMEAWKRVREVVDLATYLAEKKKPPPPPPPSLGEHVPPGGPGRAGGAEVVDFATRRKEREQRRGGAEPALARGVVSEADERTPESSESPTEAKVETKAPSGRDEQLDRVLNEALGIHGEGSTQRAAPGAVAISATAGMAIEAGLPKATVDDLLAFDKDDIFANVPRASQADLLRKESTRFFVAAAGVHRQRHRNRIGLMIGVTVAFCFAGFMAAWYAGVIAVSLPGIGNPFDRGDRQTDEEAVAGVDPNDVDRARKLLGDDARKRRKGPKPVVPPARRTNHAQAKGPDGNYVQDSVADPARAGTREGDTAGTLAFDPLTGAAQPRGEIPQARLPDSDVRNFPAIEAPTLSQETITKVINDKKESVRLCYGQSLKGNAALRGKLEFAVTIEPTGRVSKAKIETTAFKGSKIAECIANKIQDWRFPPFSGEAHQVQVPFVLEKGSY